MLREKDLPRVSPQQTQTYNVLPNDRMQIGARVKDLTRETGDNPITLSSQELNGKFINNRASVKEECDMSIERDYEVKINPMENRLWDHTAEAEAKTTTMDIYSDRNATSQRGKRLVAHVGVIRKRREIMDAEMLLLAKALFALALYQETKTSQVENCRFGVSLLNEGMNDRRGNLHISFFLKEPEADEQTSPGITWKDIVSPGFLKSLAKGRRREPTATLFNDLSSSFFWRPFRKKKKGQEFMGSYTIAPDWTVTDKAFPMGLVKLLPTATELVQAELDAMEETAQDDITFIEAFEIGSDQVSKV